MSITNEELVEILKEADLWPPVKKAPATSIKKVHSVPEGLVTYHNKVITSLVVVDGDTIEIVEPGIEDNESIRYYGIDTNETAKDWLGKPEEDYANWQTQVHDELIRYAIDKNLHIEISDHLAGYFGRTVADIRIDGSSVSGIFVGAGITPPSMGADTKVVPDTSITKNQIIANYNTAMHKRSGIWKNVGEYVYHPNNNIDEKLIIDLFNDTYSTKRKLGKGITKIGDVYLDIPPTQIAITQLRTSRSVPQLGGESKPISENSARTIIKLHLVFSGEETINTDLVRILQQFRYCPINLLYSFDIFEKVVGDNKYLLEGYGQVDDEWFIPVTMDEYTIHTIEGHPSSLGCVLQLSLFNYAAYFNGDIAEKVQYYKYEIESGEVDSKRSLAGVNRDFVYTSHLEEAVHPYNLYITSHLKDKLHMFNGSDSYTELFKVAGTRTPPNYEAISAKDAGRLSDELDELYLILSSRVKELTMSTSIFFRNNFTWLPVIGYSQPVAQYIGPGDSVVTLELQTEDNSVISSLLNTFGEESTTSIVDTFYDDRYILSNSLTRLCATEVCSMKNFSMSNVSGHPDASVINMVFCKTAYATTANEVNPVAEFDEYWGLQRILKSLDKEDMEAIETELKSDRVTRLDIGDSADSFIRLAERSGKTDTEKKVNEKTIAAMTVALNKLKGHKNSMEFNAPEFHLLQFRTNLNSSILSARMSGLSGKIILLDGLSMYSRMTVSQFPANKTLDQLNLNANKAYKTYYGGMLSSYPRSRVAKEMTRNFRDALGGHGEASRILRAYVSKVYAGGWLTSDITGPPVSLLDLSEKLHEEYLNPSYSNDYVNRINTHGTYNGHGWDLSDYDRWMGKLVDKLCHAIEAKSTGLLSKFKERWNEQSLLESKGYSVIMKFVGTAIEARVIKTAFILGSRDANRKEEVSEAREYFHTPRNISYPSFSVIYNADDGTEGTDLILTDSDANGESKNWTFQVTFFPSEHNEGISRYWHEEPDSEAASEAELEEARAKMDVVSHGNIVIPYAGHRYFPNIDLYLKHQEIFSTTVGEWFANKYIEDPYKIFEQVSESVEQSIAPLMDRPAWEATYIERSHGVAFANKIAEDPHDPCKLVAAINWMSFGKDFSEDNRDTALLKGKPNSTVDRWINKCIPDMILSSEDGSPKDLDVPFSTVHQCAALSSGYYDSAKFQGKEIVAFRMNVMSKTSMSLNTAGQTSRGYNLQNKMCAIESDGALYLPSDVPEASLAGSIDDSAKFIHSPADTQIHYGGNYANGCDLTLLQKHPEGFAKELGREQPALQALGQKDGLNTIEADAMLREKFYKILLKSNSKGAEFSKSPAQLRGIAKSHVSTLKDSIAPATNIYYMTEKLIVDYLSNGVTSELKADLKIIVSKYIADFGPLIDDATKELVSRNALESMMPTIGIENAFPTYKMYIIEEDMSDIRYFSMDDWYDLRTAQDLMIVKSKDNPAHMLKGRIIVDHRYIITSDKVNQKVSDISNPQEFEVEAPAPGIVDTRAENHFNKGMTPLREGMRICIKLGYHSDPRAMDTVFIGTITGLSGNMSTGVYDLEARGDGRELLTPPSQDVKPNISGENFAEIISIMMRNSPAVMHFGRTYGSFLEKFSRRHWALFALAKHGRLSKSHVFGAVGMSMGLAARSAIRQAAMKGSLSEETGMGMWAYMIHSFSRKTMSVYEETTALYNNTLLPLSDKGSHERWAAYSNNIFDGDDGKWGIFSSEFGNAKFSQVKGWLAGNTFDPRKASAQTAGILYNTFKQGNNPIDDNIFAIDIWNTFVPWRTFDMPINNTRTIWDVLVDIKRMYPNFALDVRPYGSRSTLFMGPKEFNIWRTDDPLQAVAPQLAEITTNEASWDDSFSYNLSAKDALRSQVILDRFGDRKPSENNVAGWVPFQRQHTVSSFSDIVMNGIRSTPYRGWNNVVVTYSKGPGDNESRAPIMQSANANLDPKAIRTKYANIDWTDDPQMAKQYAIGLLKEGVERMYGGTLIIRGNSKIEPHDKVFICDAVNKMYGWIEVETVIHKFDLSMGFTTHIVPNMVCSVNNDSYSTFSNVFRRQMVEKWGTLILGYAGGAAVGYGVAGLIGPIGWVASAVVSTAALSISVAGAYREIKSKAESIMDAAEAEGKARKEERLLSDRLNFMFLSDAVKHGYDRGIAAHYLLRLLGEDGLGIKARDIRMPKLAGKRAIKKGVDIAAERWAFASKFIGGFRDEYKVGKAIKKQALFDSIAKDVGRTIDWDAIDAAPTLTDARVKLEAELNSLIEKASEELSDDAKKTITRSLGRDFGDALVPRDTISRAESSSAGALKSTKAKLLKKVKKVRVTKGLKAAGGFGLSVFAIGADMAPALVETFVVNAMLNSNTIICHPLYSKHGMLMNGLDGYQNKTSYKHLKGMIVQAEGYVNKAKEALSEWDHMFNLSNGATPMSEDAAAQLRASAINLNEDTGVGDE